MNEKKAISFQHNEEWVTKRINNYINKKIFATKNFSNDFKIESIRKVYVPFCQFETNNTIHAFIEFTSRDSGYFYFERIINAKLKNIICCGNNINNTYISNLLPHDFKEINYGSSIINDENIMELLDINDVKKSNINDITENMKKIAIKSCPVFLSDYNNITSKCTTEYLDEEIIYLPLWIVDGKSIDHTFEFYVNDLNGKIAGDIPVNQFSNYKLFVKICLIISVLFILLTYLSIKFKNNILLYAIGIVFALLVLIFIYIGITSRYSIKYKYSNAKIISKKYIKKKRYWITELYQKARNEFEKERENDKI